MSVSKVLHGKGPNVRVSTTTAEHIRRVAQELDYRPNALARQFRSQRTRCIGMLFEVDPYFATSQYFAQIVDGVVQAAFPHGYSVTMCPTLSGIDSKESLSDGRFDGFIWVSGGQDPLRRRTIQDAGRPVVVVHEPPHLDDAAPMSYVVCDNFQGIRLGMEHLHAQGHRRVAFVTVTDMSVNNDIVVRQEAFYELAHRLEMTTPEGPLVWHHDGREFDEWWRSKPAETALFVWADAQAISILDRARQVGCKVPHDLSVVGFDSTLDCEKAHPRLTSVHQPLSEMAAEATRILISSIEDEEAMARQIIHPCSFHVRNSTAGPEQ